MCARPNVSSAWKTLCGLQRRVMLSTVEGPPSAASKRWWNSSFHVLPQRRPSGPMKVQRPWSRFQTSRRTWAGIGSRRLAPSGEGRCRARAFFAALRIGSTAPFLFPCFSIAQRTASRRTAPTLPPGILCERSAFSCSSSALKATSTVTVSE